MAVFKGLCRVARGRHLTSSEPGVFGTRISCGHRTISRLGHIVLHLRQNQRKVFTVRLGVRLPLLGVPAT